MPSFAAILGHQPHISVAELSATLKDFKKVKLVGRSVLIFESSELVNTDILNRLGGTIAIAEQIGTGKDSLGAVPGLLSEKVSSVKGQIVFSLRTLNLQPKVVRELYRDSKNFLKKQGRHARYVGTDTKPAASVLLHDAGLLDGSHGCELMVITDKDFLWIGKTVAAQDIEAYAKRDMGKPVRDTRAGLLPPKLAQVLLNFGAWMANGSENIIIYDPFCGTGVIPMECLLRGWPVLASDVSMKAVTGCEKNLEWIRKEHEIKKSETPSAVWKHDATKPFDFSAGKKVSIKNLPSAIVTETSLGVAFDKRPTIKEASSEKSESEKMEAAFLRNCSACLPGVPVICIWPVWYHSKGQMYLEKIWDVLHECNYQATLPPGVDPEVPGRLSLLYRRPDQSVGREIVLLRSRK